jgi:hypothetical protein
MSKKSLDALGVAITNAGYTWTPEMRSAYEKGIRESEWVGLTEDEKQFFKAMGFSGIDIVEAKLKEKNT